MDRSLLAGDQRMLGAVAELGRALGLRLVAEGIETAAELALAERIGCDAAQGFLFGMAVAADQLERVLDRPEHAGSDRRRTRLRAVPAGGS
jgi:EAL domain-containing protein (putative c-di-GMP-specific phosphodiesterase class I)